MTQEDMLKIKAEMDATRESTTPFAVVNDDTLAVVGDANETQTVLTDYTITFKLPNGKGGVIERDVEYKDVFITPRQETKVVKVYAELLPYYRKITNSGTIEDYSDEELEVLAGEMDEHIYDLMYELVGTVLGVAPELMEYMKLESVLEAVAKIIRNYPQ